MFKTAIVQREHHPPRERHDGQAASCELVPQSGKILQGDTPNVPMHVTIYHDPGYHLQWSL